LRGGIFSEDRLLAVVFVATSRKKPYQYTSEEKVIGAFGRESLLKKKRTEDQMKTPAGKRKSKSHRGHITSIRIQEEILRGEVRSKGTGWVQERVCLSLQTKSAIDRKLRGWERGSKGKVNGEGGKSKSFRTDKGDLSTTHWKERKTREGGGGKLGGQKDLLTVGGGGDFSRGKGWPAAMKGENW